MTEPLRIAIPIHSFEPGGVERVALNLAERWQQTGHQVSIVLGRDEGSDRGRVSAHLDYRIVSSRVPVAAAAPAAVGGGAVAAGNAPAAAPSITAPAVGGAPPP